MQPSALDVRLLVRWAAALLVAGCLGCGDGRPQVPARSVLLITLDTTRQDALGAYAAQARTPRLDRLAAEGVTYDAAYTVTPLTQPSHASMMTGLYPPRHGMRINGVGALSGEAHTLAEGAQAAGYQTAAFFGALVLDEIYGLGQGFDAYVGPERVPGNAQREKIEDRRAQAVVDDALAWFEGRDAERPYFVWVHVFDPHHPYDPPADPSDDASGADGHSGADPSASSPEERYALEVSYVDGELARLLDAFVTGDPARDPVVALVADHGEAFGEHGEYSHGLFCYDATIRVPLLLRYPDGWRAGERSDDVVSVVDLYPTLLEAMQVPVADVDGESLYYRRVGSERGVYFESYLGYLSYGTSPLIGWRDGGGTYLHSAEPELYGASDLAQERDLAGEASRADELARYRKALLAAADQPGLALEEAAATAEMAESLRALGYASAGATRMELPAPLDPDGRASPRAMSKQYQETHLGMRLFQAQDYSRAAEILTRVVRKAPQNYYAMDLLANAQMQMGLFEDALRLLRTVVTEGPGWPGSWFNMGVALVELGEREASLEPLRRAISLAPHEVQFRQYLIDILRSIGRDDEADVLEGARAE